MTAAAYPLQWPEGWPRISAVTRVEGAFQVSAAESIRSLQKNLKLLPARHVVISSNCPLRRDGTPYAESLEEVPPDPGVAVYFEYRGRQMVMAQDRFRRPYANIRSLALALEAMRAIERHGGGQMMQRSFDGFAQLPPPGGSSSAPAKRPWRVVLELEGLAGPAFAVLAGAEASYRTLAKKAHPDVPGGSSERMAELNLAINDARAECGPSA